MLVALIAKSNQSNQINAYMYRVCLLFPLVKTLQTQNFKKLQWCRILALHPYMFTS